LSKENPMQEPRNLRTTQNQPDALAVALANRLVGQPEAIDTIVPYVEMFEAALSPVGRPAGVFLLLGPTGTGKTKTVEALAAELHGSEKSLLRIDCAEFQLEHEVAKLIGAPPGYLGHRETHPMITQQKLEATRSGNHRPSLVLLDEIEKAAPSLRRLLLGVLDKGTLHLGDNSTVNFEESLVFMTSNLGAREMQGELHCGMGFRVGSVEKEGRASRLTRMAMGAVRRHFSPEFINRIDSIVNYRPLSSSALGRIFELEVRLLQEHIRRRLGEGAFELVVSESAAGILVERGTSEQYGARELKRTIHREIIRPLASRVAQDQVPRGSVVEFRARGERISIHVRAQRPSAARGKRRALPLTA
jgi:ATP-dependent Clp protease ATP-binding subunit ClpA